MTIIAHAPIVAQPSDIDQGRWLYKKFFDIDHCTNDAMRSGWQLAEAEFVKWYNSISEVSVLDAALAEYRAAPVAHLSDEAMAEIEDERIGLDEYEHRMM